MVKRIDREELELALTRSAAASDSLVGIDARPIGIGALADTFLVTLRWAAGAAGPGSLVAKLPSVDPQAARTAASLGAYEREARFYAELAPCTGLSLPAHYGTLGDGGLLLEPLIDEVVDLDRINEAVRRQSDGSSVRVMLAP